MRFVLTITLLSLTFVLTTVNHAGDCDTKCTITMKYPYPVYLYYCISDKMTSDCDKLQFYNVFTEDTSLVFTIPLGQVGWFRGMEIANPCADSAQCFDHRVMGKCGRRR